MVGKSSIFDKYRESGRISANWLEESWNPLEYLEIIGPGPNCTFGGEMWESEKIQINDEIRCQAQIWEIVFPGWKSTESGWIPVILRKSRIWPWLVWFQWWRLRNPLSFFVFYFFLLVLTWLLSWFFSLNRYQSGGRRRILVFDQSPSSRIRCCLFKFFKSRT